MTITDYIEKFAKSGHRFFLPKMIRGRRRFIEVSEKEYVRVRGGSGWNSAPKGGGGVYPVVNRRKQTGGS